MHCFLSIVKLIIIDKTTNKNKPMNRSTWAKTINLARCAHIHVYMYRVPRTIALLTEAGGAVQWKAAAEARAIRYSWWYFMCTSYKGLYSFVYFRAPFQSLISIVSYPWYHFITTVVLCRPWRRQTLFNGRLFTISCRESWLVHSTRRRWQTCWPKIENKWLNGLELNIVERPSFFFSSSSWTPCARLLQVNGALRTGAQNQRNPQPVFAYVTVAVGNAK